MKTLVTVKTNDKMTIIEAYQSLPIPEQQLLKVLSVLTCGESISEICFLKVISMESKQFRELLADLRSRRLVLNLGAELYTPVEVYLSLKDYAVSVDNLNDLLTTLADFTTIDGDVDERNVRPYFIMAGQLMSHILNISQEKLQESVCLDYNLFSKMLCNLSKSYWLWAQPDPTCCKTEDIELFQALQVCENHVEKNSLVYTSILNELARFWLSGWWYDNSLPLLEQAFNVEDEIDGLRIKERYDTLILLAEHYEAYGNLPRALSYAAKAYSLSKEIGVDDSFSIVYCSFLLSMMDEDILAQEWLEKINRDSVKSIHVKVIALLTEAMIQTNTNQIDLAEKMLVSLNGTDCPLLSRVYSVRSYIYTVLGLSKEDSDAYRKYILVTSKNYFSTDGGSYVWYSSECIRLCSNGCYEDALVIINEYLDKFRFDLNYGLMVRYSVAVAFVFYYQNESKYLSLATAYIPEARKVLQALILDEDTIHQLEETFGTLMSWNNSLAYQVEQMQLHQEELEYDHYVFRKGHEMDYNKMFRALQQSIKALRKTYPEHAAELLVREAGIVGKRDIGTANRKLKYIIKKAGKDAFDISLQSSRTSFSLGLCYDAKTYIDIALDTEEYRQLCNEKKVAVLLELCSIYSTCGLYGEACQYFSYAASIAQGSQIPEVFYEWSYYDYERENYSAAKEHIEQALIAYKQEYVTDEYLSRMYNLYASVLYEQGDYEAALKNIQIAINCFSNLYSNTAFPLLYSYALYLLANDQCSQAKLVIAKAQKCASFDYEKTMVQDLLVVASQKKEVRDFYIRRQ